MVEDLGRFSLSQLLREVFRGFRSTESTRLAWPSRIVLFILPALGGLTMIALGRPLAQPGFTALLSGGGLLVGSMVTAFVFLANLRIKMSETASLKLNLVLARMVSQTAAACLYVAATSLGVVVLAVLGLLVGGTLGTGWLGRVGTGSVLAIGLHLVFVFVTVIRRLFGAYFSVFRTDFYGASVRELRESRRKAS